MFKLSKRSRDALVGVNPQLVQVVERAIQFTKVDFAVTERVRTLAKQKELVAKGASQTMDSKHLTGQAVDLVAFIGPRVSWELSLYDEIADAMKVAAQERNLPLHWGAAWNIPDIRLWEGSMESAMQHYINTRRKVGKRPFIDAPHFEIT
jgi:peptidoglycan LD-endopeptidase CwlK